jgi:H(+)-translocating pyrophosphatase
MAAVAYPLWLAGLGILCSIVGIYVVRTNADEKKLTTVEILEALLWSIRYGVWFSTIVFTGLAALVAWMIMGNSGQEWQCYGAALIGLFGGNIIGYWTEYCTSYSREPVKSIARKAATGPATVIIQGFGVGMLSTSIPLTVLVATIIACDAIQSNYGIAIAAISMLATLGITLATDAYGPVADNAGGIAEMCHNEVDETTRGRTDALDAMGNTTAATGKGYAIASAALTSVALIAAFVDAAGLLNVNVDDAVVLAGVFIGAMLAFVFAALTMLAVGRAAEDIIFEVRRQFQAEPRLKDGEWEAPEGHKYPDYEKCVTIATNSAIMEMITPSALAIFSPFIVGYMLGSRCLTGMLVGNVTSGILLAVTMATAGGAWDNAKKFIEKEGLGPGKGKKTSFHAATVVGDTVGDPFKDTSGPALNIFIKMSALLSIVLAPSFKSVNPEGGVFPNSTFWIGIIIWVVVAIVLIIFNYYMLKKYAENAKMLSEAKGDASAAPAPAAPSAPAAAAPAQAAPADAAPAQPAPTVTTT